MTTQQKIDLLLRKVSELPNDAREELVQSLIDARAESFGIYHPDDDERAALTRSAQDERLGRFASDQEVNELFFRFGT